ncbi:hypothetical protein JWJ88_21185 (plasmid) [Paracoccus methylovorus]|uniref:Uncharacterized protein n=2 Tax=Paracoccus methylovorus TaxID=2812658 RepID=A0ABX7JRY0_9RHOB|nr:hypothetical protein JWJ88_21185 [Paracoccus methylovorus]
MMHGFTGSKNEFTIAGTETGLYTFIADRLAEAGIASLRIDFTGSSEWQDTTFSGQIADAVDAFGYLQVLPKVDGRPHRHPGLRSARIWPPRGPRPMRSSSGHR